MLVLCDETWQIKGPDFPLYIDYLLSFIFMHFNMWYLHLGSWEPERIQAAILGSRFWTSHSLGIWHFGSAFRLCKQQCISDEGHTAFKHAQAVLLLSSSQSIHLFPSKKKNKARNSWQILTAGINPSIHCVSQWKHLCCHSKHKLTKWPNRDNRASNTSPYWPVINS